MDVNGTKFHLLYDLEDWGRCLPQDDVDAGVDAQTLRQRLDEDAEERKPHFDWHQPTRSLRLARQGVDFRHSKRKEEELTLGLRRGADRDRYEHWYWIDEAESAIRFLPAGALESVTFWSSTASRGVCRPPENGDFAACPPSLPSSLKLRGLAVTKDHDLVVGDVTEHGILIFDLHRGGPPVLLKWPADVPFAPWDIAATPDGGVLILDRDHQRYWELDRHFRLLGEVTAERACFQPEGDESAPVNVARRTRRPLSRSLTTGADTPPQKPVSIEPGPDGHVLVLDAPDDAASALYEYDGETLVARWSLEDALNIFAGSGRDDGEFFSVRAHDFAYVRCCVDPAQGPDGPRDCRPASPPCLPLEAAETATADTLDLIYVAERNGDQVIAFVMVTDDDTGEPDLVPQVDFLPLRRWQGKGLVNAAGKIYYDFAGRWMPLQVFTRCRYATRAVLWTPIDFESKPPEQPFDSNQPGCVWHRLVLDGAIPAGTALFVRARAADDPELLPQMTWQPQPRPYLRSGRPELPFYTPPEIETDPDDRAGTWELLFQGIHGRYLQLELTLEGTGRSTPIIYALRAWYPRFSYLDHYLPTIYREEPQSASFLERWLANFEGFYTDLEGKIEHLPRLLDPRSAPADALNWLASWLALVLDPLWSERRRRLLIRFAHELYRWRGTVRGLEMALRAYLEDDPEPSIFDPSQYDVVLSKNAVRVVETFTRRTAADSGETDYSEVVAAHAHRFTVLVPHCLSQEDADMVERIVQLEKPAHTDFEIKRYWDLFRVGEARVGLDTELGYGDDFDALVLGESDLAGVFLPSPYPYDVADRIVLKRDRLGHYPAF